MTTTSADEASLFTQTVTMLTQAATRRNGRGATDMDFADFLINVLAATAANVGGPDHLLTGRHSSWEAAHLDELLRTTIGDQADWLWFRTTPLAIRLNVAQLIEDDLTHPGLMGLDEALESLGRRYESATVEAEVDAWDSDIDTVTARYSHEYQLYAHRFTTAVHTCAQQQPGLTVRIEVHADTDPNSAWWTAPAITNPTPDDGDQLALRIWQAAHDATPLPNVDIWRHPAATTTRTPS